MVRRRPHDPVTQKEGPTNHVERIVSLPDAATSMADNDDRTQSGDHPTLIPSAPRPELNGSDLRITLPLDSEALERAASGDGSVELFGQSRALDALRLAIGIDAPGYNVYVNGLRARQEREAVMLLLAEKRATVPTPSDWVYLS